MPFAMLGGKIRKYDKKTYLENQFLGSANNPIKWI